MISVLEACKIATENDRRPYVIGINEHPTGYVISTSDSDEVLDVGCGTFVSKDDGTVSSFFPPDHFGEQFKKVDIPKRYRYK